MTEYIFRDVHYGYTDGTALGRTLEKQEEIVRCRDCRYFRIGTNTDSCVFTDKYAHPNGFCSWGERRTNDN